MAGHRRELGPNRHELIVHLGKDPVTGKKRYRSKVFHGGVRAADKELTRLAAEADKERPATTQTVSWLMDEYCRLLVSEARSKKTMDTYNGYIDNWIKPSLGTIKLEDLTAGDVRKLAASMTKAERKASTIRQVHAIVRGALRFAVQNDWVDRNVAALAGPPKLSPTTVVAATPIEADALYRASGKPGEDLPTAIVLGTHTGARLGELCALRWSNVDSRSGIIHFYSTKTHQTGDVPITATLMQRLKERHSYQAERALGVGVALDPDPYILSFWADGSRKPVSGSYSHAFQRVRDVLGLSHIHFHTLRHAFVTQALAAGVDPLTVSKLVRHRDMTMIGRVYGHGTPEAFQDAKKKIDRAFKTTKKPALDPPKKIKSGL